MKRFPLARRTFLRGSGALLALPFFEAMLPSKASAAGPPVRFAAIYCPNGPPPNEWAPNGTGTSYSLSNLFDALEPHKADINLCVNVSHQSDSQHPGHCSAFLSGHMPPDDVGHAALTIDQLIADQIGSTTKIKTMALTPPGSCPNFGPQTGVYGTNMSWTSETTPVARMVDPKQIFADLVTGRDNPTPVPTDLYKKSILDFVLSDADRLHQRLGAQDRAVLDEYMDNVRAIEKKLAAIPGTLPACGGLDQPGDDYDHPGDLEVKMDLMALALQCDATRVATFVLDWDGDNRNYGPFIPGYGNGYGYHEASHSDQDRLRLITRFMVEKFSYLLNKLKAMPEAGGSVLTNSLVLFGSSFSNDPDLHAKKNLPLVLAGNAGGAVQTGRAIAYPQGTVMRQLLLTLLQTMGVQASSFGGEDEALPL